MLSLAPRADLGVFYDADAARYRVAGRHTMTDRVSREAFMSFYGDCPSIGFRRGGQDIGGILYDGTQAHIAVLPEHHGHWGALLKPALQWLFSLSDDILVEVEPDNAACLRFMAHVGWVAVGRQPDALLFRLRPRPGTRRTAHPPAPRGLPHCKGLTAR